MRKSFLLTMITVILMACFSSCAYEACPTYAHTSLRPYTSKHSVAYAKAKKKQKKNRF